MADLAELLLSHNEIDWNQLESARSQQAYSGKRIEHILVESRMIPESRLTDAIARVTKVRRLPLDELTPDGGALAKLRPELCEREVIFPVALRDEGRTLWIATTDPTDLALLDRTAQTAGCRVRPVVAGLEEIRRAIRRVYHGEEVAAPTEQAPPDADEFKITDMSGNTVMTSLDVLRRQAEAAGDAPAAARAAPPPPVDEDPAEALFAPSALGPEEQARLEKLAANQRKSGIVLKALLELLEERGLLGPGDVDL